MAGAKPVRVLDAGQTHLTIVGCGGTGGYLVNNVCRLVWGLKEQRRLAHDAPPIFGERPPRASPASSCAMPTASSVETSSVKPLSPRT